MIDNTNKNSTAESKDNIEGQSRDNRNEFDSEDNPGSDKGNADNTKLASSGSSNTHLRRLISSNYIEYSSYVIKERAIPELRDGLKPVQRRILWSLYRMDDGKFHKVANIVGHSMQYHPHGDASIYQSLVNLANKEYFIDKQGNFGNILTGDEAAAARYIEARLTPLGREVLFNPEITEFTASYDGRNKEPVFLPAKIPVLLMVGQEGIAPGMTTTVLPHNFQELLKAQVSVLNNEDFVLYPDFIQGGIMDVSEYDNGLGKITLRAKIDIEGRKLIIREIPAFTYTEKLISSIERAVNKNKIKLASINDYTAESVEIELVPARGYKPEKALKALYMYTDCEISVSSSILVIKDNRPEIMNVSDIVKEYTDFLVKYLRAELQIELDKLNDRFHERTLERIFIENRIYKRIEKCETYKLVQEAVRSGLKPYLSQLKREVTEKDIEKLLGIPIRRISKFDINKNREETEKILASIKEVENNLKNIIEYTINYLESLLRRFGKYYSRRTKISELEEIDKKAAALNNIKVGWDRRHCYIGSSVKSDDPINCNEYDHLICIEKSGRYKVISIPQKVYAGRLYYFNKYSKNNVYSVIYKEKKTGVYYVKRTKVDKFIRDKEYNLIPKGCQLEQLTIRDNSIYECILEMGKRKKTEKVKVDFSQVQMRNPGTRGFKLTDKKIKKIVFTGFADTDEKETDENKDNDNEHKGKTTQGSSDKTEQNFFTNTNNNAQVQNDAESVPNIKNENGEGKKEIPDSKKNELKGQGKDKNIEPHKNEKADKNISIDSGNDQNGQEEEGDLGIIQPDLGF
ncbi:MAG: DNA topoisomerase IV subunit A [Victivallales bacterium]|nr:DNA topoisomerase IV subunit A [Victivallales bacterium]MCF7889404.1 DNA topoisomerase IV subunit A [Victivallales bacterium]